MLRILYFHSYSKYGDATHLSQGITSVLISLSLSIQVFQPVKCMVQTEVTRNDNQVVDAECADLGIVNIILSSSELLHSAMITVSSPGKYTLVC